MRRRRAGLCAAVVAALAIGAAGVSAAPPRAGVLVPGKSLGGLRIGMTKPEVQRAWGARFGRCRSCVRETWYFNYRRFAPEGAAVAFVRGRVVHVYTLWQPEGWRTSRGLRLGASESDVRRAYGHLARRACLGYSALVLRGSAASIFYVDGAELWGFGLTRPGLSPCV